MDEKILIITILGMAVVTYLPRLLPVWLLATRTLPQPVITWLKYIPAAVLSAMLVPSLLLPAGEVDISFSNLYLMAAFPTLLAGWKSKSLFLAVIVGMAFVAITRLLFHL
jgi:branched-subunit amino acid transport protein